MTMKRTQAKPAQKAVPLSAALFFSKTLDFLEVLIPKQKDGSKNTVETYRTSLSMFRDFVRDEKNLSIRDFQFADCTYDLVLDYRNWLRDTRNFKESTTNNRLAAIKSYIAYAAARDITLQQIAFAVSEDPILKVPKVIRPVIEQEDTLSAFLDAPGNTRLGLRDRAILVMLFDTAIRVDELVRLCYADVNLSVPAPYIHVHGKGNKERKVYFSSRAFIIIGQYAHEFHPGKKLQTAFFYTTIHGAAGHMSRRNVERVVKKYADAIRPEHPDLPESVSPHTIRRTRATGLFQDGVDLAAISTMLGHSLIQTPKDHYAIPSIEQMRSVMEQGSNTEPEEAPLWSEDEDELARLCGLR